MALSGGVDIRDYRVAALKRSAQFRNYFTPVATRIIRADSPGGSSGIITTFRSAHLRGPVYLFNSAAQYP